MNFSNTGDIKSPQSRVLRADSRPNVQLICVASLAGLLMLMIVGSIFTAYFWKAECPAATFAISSIGTTPYISICFFCFVVLSISLSTMFVEFISGVSKFHEFYSAYAPKVAFFQQDHRVYAAAGALLSSLIICCCAPFCLLDVKCVSPFGIYTRSFPLDKFKQYPWDGVSTLMESCWYSGKAKSQALWYYEVDAVFHGGEVFKVENNHYSEGQEAVISDEAYGLARVLRDHPIKFDATRVPRGCRPPDLRVLGEKPHGALATQH